MNEIKNIKP